MRYNCCADQTCDTHSCMTLPTGASCADCKHSVNCAAAFSKEPADTSCNFFPRRFAPNILPVEPRPMRDMTEPDLGLGMHRFIVEIPMTFAVLVRASSRETATTHAICLARSFHRAREAREGERVCVTSAEFTKSCTYDRAAVRAFDEDA